MEQTRKSVLITWLWAGLLVGTLDLAAALLQFMWRSGRDPFIVLRFIASGVFGPAAFAGPSSMIWYGLLFHFLFAFGFTLAFLLIYPRLGILRRRPFVTGFIYGIFVWLVMNLVVLPFAGIKIKGQFDLSEILTGILILTLAIGLPLAFIAKWLYDKGSKRTIEN
ncbi:MAG TPA: hypothetical protein VFR58_14035 [Flavisolibacter sp.]|nr:hypothetical protein [Flavisolibacter sp.]